MTLQGKQVLVTGASGFVGGAAVERLLADGAVVRGMVRSLQKGERIKALGAELALGDLTDAGSLRQAVSGCSHVFSVGAAMRGPLDVQMAVNVTGIEALVDICHESGVSRVVHVSSIATYGYRAPDIVTEATALRPSNEYYGQTKALGEQRLMSRAAELDLPASVVRPGMIYGPRSGFWTGKMFDLMKYPIAVLPGGDNLCPAIYIDDLVDLLVLCAEHPSAAGEVFNGTMDPPPTWSEFLGAYARMTGRGLIVPVPHVLLRAAAGVAEAVMRLRGTPSPLRDMVDGVLGRKRVYSMDKAADLLGWSPRTTLAEGMANAEVWLRESGRLA